jgi:hypothetical protein
MPWVHTGMPVTCKVHLSCYMTLLTYMFKLCFSMRCLYLDKISFFGGRGGVNRNPLKNFADPVQF